MWNFITTALYYFNMIPITVHSCIFWAWKPQVEQDSSHTDCWNVALRKWPWLLRSRKRSGHGQQTLAFTHVAFSINSRWTHIHSVQEFSIGNQHLKPSLVLCHYINYWHCSCNYASCSVYNYNSYNNRILIYFLHPLLFSVPFTLC